MVLDDVARRTDPVVIPRATPETDVLGHRDLHVVDIMGVPDRIEQLVRETQCQDVLDCFLAEIVVDAEHRILGEHLTDDGVEVAGTLLVVPERLLDHHAAPRTVLRFGESGSGQLPADHRERGRRNRQVERVVTARAALTIELFECGRQFREGVVVVERTLHEADTFGETLPHLLTERGA